MDKIVFLASCCHPCFSCHSREGGNPEFYGITRCRKNNSEKLFYSTTFPWIPASAGMTSWE